MVYELVTGTELNDKERWKLLMCASAYYKNSCSTYAPNCYTHCLKTMDQRKFISKLNDNITDIILKSGFFYSSSEIWKCIYFKSAESKMLYVKVSLTMYANTTLSEHKSVPLHFICIYAKCIMHVITSASEILYCMNAWSQRFLNFHAGVNYQ